MATRVLMRQGSTGLTRDGYFGFSWTTFFFGFFPPLFRGDFLTFAATFGILVLINIVMFALTFGLWWLFIWVPGFIWAFKYNSYYTRRLIERGYVFADTPEINQRASIALGVVMPVGEQITFNAPISAASVEDDALRRFWINLSFGIGYLCLSLLAIIPVLIIGTCIASLATSESYVTISDLPMLDHLLHTAPGLLIFICIASFMLFVLWQVAWLMNRYRQHAFTN